MFNDLSSGTQVEKLFIKICEITIAIVLVVAGTNKILYHKSFYKAVDNIEIFSENIKELILIFIPPIEIALGLCILFMKNKRIANLSAMSLFFLFTLYAVYNLLNYNTANCGCFGDEIVSDSPTYILIRNLMFLTMSVVNYKMGASFTKI